MREEWRRGNGRSREEGRERKGRHEKITSLLSWKEGRLVEEEEEGKMGGEEAR